MVILSALMLISTVASAQFLGLPVATSAGSQPEGVMFAGGGITLGDDYNLYGGRFSVSPASFLTVFGDLGLIDPDDGEIGFAMQGGCVAPLPIEGLPIDIAARAAIGYTAFDIKGDGFKGDLTALSLNGGIVISHDFDQFTPYAFAGLQYTDATVKVSGHKASDDDTDLAVAAGALVKLVDTLSLYAEIAHVDDVFFSIGVRYGF